MQNNIQFDFNRAQNLIDLLKDCKKRLTAAAEEIKSAAPDENWWAGPSQQAFAERLFEAFPDLDEYGGVVDDTLNYVKKVSEDKSDFEKKGKARFK